MTVRDLATQRPFSVSTYFPLEDDTYSLWVEFSAL